MTTALIMKMTVMPCFKVSQLLRTVSILVLTNYASLFDTKSLLSEHIDGEYMSLKISFLVIN